LKICKLHHDKNALEPQQSGKVLFGVYFKFKREIKSVHDEKRLKEVNRNIKGHSVDAQLRRLLFYAISLTQNLGSAQTYFGR